MADDRWYLPGDNYILDMLSGFKIRASRAKKIPGGQTGNLWVAPERWEPQQFQDFVRGVVDDQTVAIANPRQKNRFVILGTYVTAPAARGSQTIQVDSTVGFNVGMEVQIMLDSGENQIVSLTSISGKMMSFYGPLQAGVGGNFGDPLENMVLEWTGAPSGSSGLYNSGGVLGVEDFVGLPPDNGGAPSTFWSNGGVMSAVLPVAYRGGVEPVYFGTVTAAQLIAIGPGGLTDVQPAAGTGQLWIIFGEVWVA